MWQRRWVRKHHSDCRLLNKPQIANDLGVATYHQGSILVQLCMGCSTAVSICQALNGKLMLLHVHSTRRSTVSNTIGLLCLADACSVRKHEKHVFLVGNRPVSSFYMLALRY